MSAESLLERWERERPARQARLASRSRTRSVWDHTFGAAGTILLLLLVVAVPVALVVGLFVVAWKPILTLVGSLAILAMIVLALGRD